MTETFGNCQQKTLPGLSDCTSSPESADGNSPFKPPPGPRIIPSGQAHALVSRFHQPEGGELLTIRATCGLFGQGSSSSANLQSSLESKLRAKMAAHGSPEYELTWKRWDMPSGPPICRLRAWAPRTSGRGCGGWPTVDAGAFNVGADPVRHFQRPGATKTLGVTAGMAGWQTPSVGDADPRSLNTLAIPPSGQVHNQQLAAWPTPHKNAGTGAGTRGGGGMNIQMAAGLAGWASPRSNKWGMPDSHGDNQKPLGQTSASSGAQTECIGALNPEHCRWLMGFPAGWARLEDTETAS